MTKTLLSWSSGKDSAWALYRLRQNPEIEVIGLLTTVNSEFSRVAMHGVRQEVLRAQAQAAGLPLWEIPLPWPCSNEVYESRMKAACERALAEGVEAIAFGDLYLEDVRAYREKQLAPTGLRPLFPLWQIPTDRLAREMLAAGLRAKLSCVDTRKLPRELAGCEFDEALLRALPAGTDPCAENGEFHTCAYAGPMFRQPLRIDVGEIVERDGFAYADLLLAAEQTDAPGDPGRADALKIRAIVTGTTGMVGEGVLLECLNHPDVERVLSVSRKPAGYSHPKLRAVVYPDFFDLAPLEAELAGYNACFFCLGVSSIGMSKEEYRHVTYDLTLNFAQMVAKLNPEMTFCYVTGPGTDSSEQGSTAWARVKGATENALLRLFRRAYMFRPAFMRATPGQKHLKSWYKFMAWIYPIGRALYPAGFCTLQEVGQAMIHSVSRGYTKQVLEVKDIVELGKG